ncbi:hypothetical protein GCM10023184_23470 [Flaviaesturariibacter amylovorans]|uniref:SMP-30/Gluconolactonase/LRE-like region domain-containing protein n=2 Tax=Flaviaesturariibacter amylovorans TaxID=1084520 RepID=A0ABP8GY53_9BACT
MSGTVYNTFGSVFGDSQNSLYVIDLVNKRVIRNGVSVAGGNGTGTLPNQFTYLVDGCVDNEGNIYILDRISDFKFRVQKWAPGAAAGVTVYSRDTVGGGLTPKAITVDAYKNLYIAEWANEVVWKIPAGGGAAYVVAGGNGRGNAPNQFDNISDIELDHLGNLYVSDLANSRIQKWVPGATSGVTEPIISPTSFPGQVLTLGIYIDKYRRLFIARDGRVSRWQLR